MMDQIKNKKIIIAEDNEFSRVLVSTKLRKFGFENITSPESSVEVWELIAESTLNDKPYDLLITDLNMPDLDGVDLISKIKDDPLSEKLNIIVITADADNSIKQICQALGVQAYITKPFDVKNFIDIVSASLNGDKITEVIPFFK